jgi:glycosyltransferase involved in cell wall biosynthesis
MLNHIVEIAKRVQRAHNEVALISREAEVKPKDIPVYRMKFLGASIPFFRNLVFPAKSLRVLEGFDLVHTQYHPDIFAGSMAAEVLRKKHVFTYHGFAPVRSWNNPKQRLKMIDHRLGTFLALRSKVSKIVTVSRFLKNELIKKYLVDDKLVRVVYNGVDTKRFNPEVEGHSIRKFYKIEGCPVVLYLGRLAPYKGVHFLLTAIPDILKEMPKTKFLISGARRYDIANLGDLIKSPKIRNAVIFTKYVPDEDVPKLYACCDLFCYPSLWEGFGLTPAEAQACGRPVVAFNTCALPEVVENNKTGSLVEVGDVKALSETITALLQDENRRRQMGMAARKRVIELFSWDKAAKETLRIYNEVVS